VFYQQSDQLSGGKPGNVGNLPKVKEMSVHSQGKSCQEKLFTADFTFAAIPVFPCVARFKDFAAG